jgi:hypothetical protein
MSRKRCGVPVSVIGIPRAQEKAPGAPGDCRSASRAARDQRAVPWSMRAAREASSSWAKAAESGAGGGGRRAMLSGRASAGRYPTTRPSRISMGATDRAGFWRPAQPAVTARARTVRATAATRWVRFVFIRVPPSGRACRHSQASQRDPVAVFLWGGLYIGMVKSHPNNEGRGNAILRSRFFRLDPIFPFTICFPLEKSLGIYGAK